MGIVCTANAMWVWLHYCSCRIIYQTFVGSRPLCHFWSRRCWLRL